MDPKHKSLLIYVGLAVAALLGLAWCCSDDGEKKYDEDAKLFYRMVMGEVNKVSKAVSGKVENNYEYDADGLLKKLTSCLRKLEVKTTEAKGLEEKIESLNKIEQPKDVVDECKADRERIKKLNAECVKLQKEAENLYEATLEEWELKANEPDKTYEAVTDAEKILAEMPKYKAEAEERRKLGKPHWKGRRLYTQLIDKIFSRKVTRLKAQLDKRNAEIKGARASRNQVITNEKVGEGDAAKYEVDHNKPKMVEIDTTLKKIKECKGGNESVAMPDVKPEPKPMPPPEFKPDLVLTATGDLPETLLRPLVVRWLAENRAQPAQGNQFIWANRKGNFELEANVPAALQGTEPGKLRIRIVPVQNAAAAFEAVGVHGSVNLMLTGITPDREMLACWLPEGTSQEQLGREFKARVCYDALVFFKGNGLKLESPLRSAEMKKKPTVYSVNDAARCEAAQVFGLIPNALDVQETETLSMGDLRTNHADKMIFGVWHKDAAGALSYSKAPTISYAAGWESEAAFKHVPVEYMPYTEGIAPTPESIATGRYAFSYSIYGYRSTRDTGSRSSDLAADLLAFIANAENGSVAQIISDAGFVPVELGMDNLKRDNELTRDDLPIPVLLKAMGKDAEKFGYDVDEAMEDKNYTVYGVRVPFAIYFKTGSAQGGEGQVTLDADAAYYTSTDAFARIQELVKNERAVVVVVGHADIQHKGTLRVDAASWKSNLDLSQRRAVFLGTDLKKKFPGSKLLSHVAIGTGWARPACDISLNKDTAAQENELFRCRRAEVFIVFPVPGSGE